jgi:two-component system, sensor histidine kinase YesM
MDIKRWYLDLSIKYKILLFIYTLILFVSLILGFYSYFASEKYIVNKINSSKVEVLNQLNSSISFVMDDVNDISLYLCLDQGVQEFLSKKQDTKEDVSQNRYNTYPTYNSLEFIMSLIASKGYIGSVMIYNENGLPPYNASTDRGGMLSDFSMVKNSQIYKDAKALEGSLLWEFLPTGDSTIIENNVSNKLVMCRIIKDFDYDLGEIGFIVMTINEFNIKSLYPTTLNQNNESILIIDSHGRVISNEGEAGHNLTEKDIKTLSESINNNKGNFINTIAQTKMSVNYSKVANTDWKIVYLVPVDNMVGELNSIKIITILIVLICLIVSFPLTLIISNYLTAPIKLLLKSMKRFQEGNFNERVNFKYNDEIGMLGKGYDNMVGNIKELIDKAYVLQIKEREAELDALQAQINPHFLYNTLDTIFWKAERTGNKEIGEMVYSLSKLFRLSLNRGKGSTLVCREKELIENYLLLQKIRYKDHLDYTISIEPNILNMVIPKLILQPFIENSIRHGIETKEFGGTIKVSGKLQGDKLHFIVEDDGMGMSQEKIEMITGISVENITSDSYGNGSYAVKNVNDRLKLNYGDNYTLNFTSELGKGTIVELIIPVLPSESQREGTL